VLNFVPWIAFWVLIATALGNVVDFLIGDQGRKTVKDRLADWYVALEDGNASSLLLGALSETEALIDHWFGRRILSKRAVIVGCLLVATMCIIVILPQWIAAKPYFSIPFVSVQTSREIPQALIQVGAFSLQIAIWTFMLAVFDVPSMMLSRLVIRRSLQKPSFSNALLAVAFVLVLSYFAIAAPDASAELLGLSHDMPVSSWLLWPYTLIREDGFRHTFLLMIPAATSGFLLLSILLPATALVLTRPVTKAPFCVLVERLAEAPQGVFTTLGVAAGAVVGLLSALAAALAPKQ